MISYFGLRDNHLPRRSFGSQKGSEDRDSFAVRTLSQPEEFPLLNWRSALLSGP